MNGQENEFSQRSQDEFWDSSGQLGCDVMNIKYRAGKFIQLFGYNFIRSDRLLPFEIPILSLAISLWPENYELNIVQIGAYDGLHSDPLRAVFASRTKFKAVLLEPQPAPFENLRKLYNTDRRFNLINGVLHDRDGECKLYLPRDISSDASPTTASLDQTFAFKRSSKVDEVTVSAMTWKTLKELTKMYCCDVLQIDAEGMDATLVSHVLDSGDRPSLINFEIANLSRYDLKVLINNFERAEYKLGTHGSDCLAAHSHFLGMLSSRK